jgi:tetratricopeptide (TPR) repeat protein
MNRPLNLLTQQELLALAVEATRRGDSGHSLAYLKEAAERDDVAPEALFLLGSEYAQISMVDDARACLERAIAKAPNYAIARFQLGFLHLTGGQAQSALDAWEPLNEIDDSLPQAPYLLAFHKGMQHLIRDEFEEALLCLEKGVGLNQDNPALNGNMQFIMDKLRAALAQQSSAVSANQSLQPPTLEQRPGDAAAAVDEDEANHLLINAYTRGKPH